MKNLKSNEMQNIEGGIIGRLIVKGATKLGGAIKRAFTKDSIKKAVKAEVIYEGSQIPHTPQND